MHYKNYFKYLKVTITIVLLFFSFSVKSQNWKSQEEFDLYMDSLDLEIQNVRYTDIEKSKVLINKFYDLSEEISPLDYAKLKRKPKQYVRNKNKKRDHKDDIVQKKSLKPARNTSFNDLMKNIYKIVGIT